MDTAGAFAGPLVAIGLMLALADDIRAVFWIAVDPGGRGRPHRPVRGRGAAGRRRAPARPPLRLADLKGLDRAYWALVGLGLLFTLARFSEAFLILKASARGPAALAGAGGAGGDEPRLFGRAPIRPESPRTGSAREGCFWPALPCSPPPTCCSPWSRA